MVQSAFLLKIAKIDLQDILYQVYNTTALTRTQQNTSSEIHKINMIPQEISNFAKNDVVSP